MNNGKSPIEIAVEPPPREDAFPIYSGIWRSFYDRSFYCAVIYYWRRFWVYYALLLIVVIELPTLAYYRIQMGDFINTEMPGILLQFPAIEVKNGEAALANGGELPLVIKNSSNEPVMLIDTRKKSVEISSSEAPLVLAKDMLYLEQNPGEIHVLQSFDEASENFVWNAEMVDQVVSAYHTWLLPLMIPIGLAFKLLGFIIQTALYSCFGLVMAWFRGMVIPYRGIWRLSVIATTPAYIAQELLMPVIGAQIIGIVSMVLLFGYMWFGLDSIYKSVTKNLKL